MAEYKNGILKTYENNCMSLSCHADIKIKDGVINDMHYKGMPRTEGRDAWFRIYQSFKRGQKIDKQIVEYLLSYNGKHNIISVFEEGK